MDFYDLKLTREELEAIEEIFGPLAEEWETAARENSKAGEDPQKISTERILEKTKALLKCAAADAQKIRAERAKLDAERQYNAIVFRSVPDAYPF